MTYQGSLSASGILFEGPESGAGIPKEEAASSSESILELIEQYRLS
jgi:hypothetical protein